jgi:hypothetical protein
MITHNIYVEGKNIKGFFSLCKCALYGLKTIYKDNAESEIIININSNLYGLPTDNIYEKYFIPKYKGEGGELFISNDHPGMYFNFKLDVRYTNTKLANDFFKPKEHLQLIINNVSKNLGKNPLGIHYRGTDHWDVATIFNYDIFCDQVKHFFDSWKPSSVFMASDEKGAIDAVSSIIPNLIYLDHIRSEENKKRKNAIHKIHNDFTRLGNEAIIDSYILSKCSALISGESNLSDWAIILSPGISHIKLI